jgi:hypothetical protein
MPRVADVCRASSIASHRIDRSVGRSVDIDDARPGRVHDE